MNTRKLVHLAMFVVLEVVASRFISIPLPTLKIGVTFIPMALCGYFYGYLPSMVVAGLADIIGATLFPQGPYFPGFTISSLLIGLSYGQLKGKDNLLKHIVIAVLFNSLIVNLGFNTLWLDMMYGKGFLAMIPVRAAKTAIMIPIEIATIYAVLKSVKRMNLD
ncbi:MAG: folate family ECF transporter S component [Erysipelothrix sp.]